MNILYILPWDTTYKYKTAFLPALSYQPLTLSTLAALTPDKLSAFITLVDEGVMTFDYMKNHYDLVGISVCTSGSLRGYELADFFRARGSYVILGGHHATLLPEEAARHADSVFQGSAEVTLPAFFEDFLNGTPKPFYCADSVRADKIPIPRRDLMPQKGYLRQPTIIADYGCENSCKYCVIHSFWGRSARRPIESVVNEIRLTGAKEYLFLDPSPLSNKAYAKELFEALIPLNIKWAGLATLDITDNEELLASMAKSGCVGTLLGFETFNTDDLNSMNKYQNKVQEYRTITGKLHDYGIAVLGTFMLGFDGDTNESLRELPDLIAQTKIDVPRFAILTPYPNTPLFEQLETEGRILHRDWSQYDSVHCVFEPKNMSAATLESAHLDIWKRTYSAGKIVHRLRSTPQRKGTALITNVGFKIYGHRLRGLVQI
ncbi:MAG: B12-binding domain-containing radical SAM protein [Peptococcaceae bacterium]|nr:B12-binding domain-containing radical SAM protein [Peptococcaceae bacterium]